MAVLKPYLLLACVSFAVGFVGYWMVGRAVTSLGPEPATPAFEAPISAPAPADAFDAGKRI